MPVLTSYTARAAAAADDKSRSDSGTSDISGTWYWPFDLHRQHWDSRAIGGGTRSKTAGFIGTGWQILHPLHIAQDPLVHQSSQSAANLECVAGGMPVPPKSTVSGCGGSPTSKRWRVLDRVASREASKAVFSAGDGTSNVLCRWRSGAVHASRALFNAARASCVVGASSLRGPRCGSRAGPRCGSRGSPSCLTRKAARRALSVARRPRTFTPSAASAARTASR